MNQADDWSEYWSSEGSSGEVFVNKDGQRHPRLETYWRTQLAGLQENAKIIDLACGAGSVYSHLPDNSEFLLYAADLSHEALQLLKKRVPGALSVTCSVVELPFVEAKFDLVVSQFGIEYAGGKAFLNAASLIKNGGRLAILCHYEEGYIDDKNRGHLTGAQAAQASSFISLGRKLAEAMYSKSQSRFDKAEADFLPAEQKLAEMTRCYEGGVHSHLYLGFRQLIERYEHYALSDITDWLSAMSGELEKNIIRLEAMRNAACNEEQIKSICKQLSKIGLRKVGYSPFTIESTDNPIAWSITAEKP